MENPEGELMAGPVPGDVEMNPYIMTRTMVG